MLEVKLGKYQHYKGNYYEVIGVARDADNLEEMVVYRGLYDDEEFGKNPLWLRPKKEFLENVTWEGNDVERFKYQGAINNKQ